MKIYNSTRGGNIASSSNAEQAPVSPQMMNGKQFLKNPDSGDSAMNDKSVSFNIQDSTVNPASPNNIKKDGRAMGGSSRRAVTFAKHGDEDEDNNNKGMDGSGGGRVAAMKAKLRSSFSADSMNNSSYGRSSDFGGGMDDSWGGALGMEGLDMSSSDDDDEDDDSLGDFVGSDMLDESENFRARAEQSMSFNMSFMQVGLGDDLEDLMNGNRGGSSGGSSMDKSAGGMGASSRRRKNTGRGSIFVIADEKFGKTKVVQARLEKAAKKLQRFLRRCLLVLRQYTEEREYFKNELKDIEERRKEELLDIERFVQEEKEQFQMELEHELNAGLWTPEEWDTFHKEQEDLKEQTHSIRTENETFKHDIKRLKRENNQLEIVDPEQVAERTRMEAEVPKLQKDIDDWTRIKSHYKNAVEEAGRKIEMLAEKRKDKRAERKKTEKTINKIIKLLEEKTSEDDENSVKILHKVQKLKEKREKKLKKLKARTILEQQQQLAGIAEEDEHAADEHEKQEQEKEQRRRGRRRSRKQRDNDKDDEMPELGSFDAAETKNPDAAAGQGEDKVPKKDKDKKKTKKKKDKAPGESRDSQDADASALMKVYNAQQREKAAEKEKEKEKAKKSKRKSSVDIKKNADDDAPLLSLIMG